MRSFSGAYGLEITLSTTRCPGMPLQKMTFDVVMGRSLDNYPEGSFRGMPGDPFDAGQVAVRPEGLAIRFGNALIVGTPYVARSSTTWPREGRFEISGGRGRFVAGKMDLPNFEIVGLGPDGNYRVRPNGDYEIWRCDAVDHGVTFLPIAGVSAEFPWRDQAFAELPWLERN
jgi:hypothetical protein